MGLAGISPPSERTKTGTAREKKQSSVRSVPRGKKGELNSVESKRKGRKKNPRKVGDRLSLESRGKPKQSHRAGRPVKNQRERSTQ